MPLAVPPVSGDASESIAPRLRVQEFLGTRLATMKKNAPLDHLFSL
jgi:hypothetical protein